MLILSGSTPLYVLLLHRSRTPRYRPSSGCPSGGLVLDDDLDVAHRRTEIGRQGAQRVVNRLFEQIIETRLERASISAMVPESVLGLETASPWGLRCSTWRQPAHQVQILIPGRSQPRLAMNTQRPLYPFSSGQRPLMGYQEA